ncbi:hypothetical protein ACFC3F_04780 [Microbacterium sp. NPDC055910]|uniref:hypothetical protein n=1 Tax=Microbacterium sp. NPDC055910 TaxID=3345659 RepID=UPI0035E1756B
MTSHTNHHLALDPDRAEAIENVVEEVADEIRHGQVSGDVSHLLGQRLDAAGIALPPEAVEDLAEDIETEVSL